MYKPLMFQGGLKELLRMSNTFECHSLGPKRPESARYLCLLLQTVENARLFGLLLEVEAPYSPR